MTIEERFDFLFQSIESHDQQIRALVENQQRSDQVMKEGFERVQLNLDRLEGNLERLEGNVERLEGNVNRLAVAMLGLTDHSADHQRRIEKLEGKNS
jgi:peptidoglycan hydrolase CwlO-like protein